MSERSLTIETQGTATTHSPTVIPTPRAPIGSRGSAPAPETRPTSVQPTPDALPTVARIAPPTARAAATEGAPWVEHPLYDRLRAILRGGPRTLEERHAAILAARGGRVDRIDTIAAQARLFTGMR